MDGTITDVTAAIADAEGVEPSELDYQLYDYVDPEALELLASRSEDSWTLTFSVPDHEVTVTDEGQVLVEDQRVERPA
jgi:hypothetical protein